MTEPSPSPDGPLIDVVDPELLEDTFPYHAVPRILFDGVIHEQIDGCCVEFDPIARARDDIHVTDTTFRDGQQSRPPYTVEQITTLYDYLARLGGPNGVIRQAEFFVYTQRQRDAVDSCREQGHEYPVVCGWIRADEGELRRVKEMQLTETAILTSASDYLIFQRDRRTRRQAFDHYIRIVEDTIAAGIRPVCELEDVTRADIRGFVVPFVRRLMELSESLPENLKARVVLCDTLGFGVSFPGVALPRSIPKLVYRMTQDAGVPSHLLEWHGHNDFHRVHINGLSAWLYGANAVHATLFGIGERTGNSPLEGAMVEYAALKGEEGGVDLRVISEIAEYFDRHLDADISAHHPFVGSNFNVTRAGIHAGGLRRDQRTYNIFDTGSILGRPPRMVVTDISGVEGIVLWANDFLGLAGRERLRQIDVVKVAKWVVEEYERGRTTEITVDELVDQIRTHLPGHYREAVDRGQITPDQADG